MKLYLDDDSVDPLLVRLLRQAEHDVCLPADTGLSGADDPVHLTQAIADRRSFLSRNHDDFLQLHVLIMQARGHHAGIVIVRRDNDPTRDMTPRGTVHAISCLLESGVPLPDQFHILNHWR
jgi:hypothetical protein